MHSPVNLDNLREMTDGDAEMEKGLFNEFFSSFEEGVHALQEHGSSNSNEAWRSQAHALKGMCFNLGAETLGDLCKQAQEQHLATLDVKHTLLQQIWTEYDRVRQFLHAQP